MDISLDSTLAYFTTLGPYQAIGLTGVALYVIAFGLVQVKLITGDGLVFAAGNVAAAGCLLVSLIVEFNLSTLLINASFFTIGMIGIVKRLLRQRRARREVASS